MSGVVQTRRFTVFSDTGFYFAVWAMANVSSYCDCLVWRTGLFLWTDKYSGTVFTVKQCFVKFLPLLSVTWWHMSLQTNSVNLEWLNSTESSPRSSYSCVLPPFCFFICKRFIFKMQMYLRRLKKAALKQKIPQVFVVWRNPPNTTQCKTPLILITAHRLLSFQ